MPTQKIAKNLPKRCSNAHAKETRKASWTRGQARKEQRRKESARRHKANLDLVAAGGVAAGGRTSWPRQRLHGEAKAAYNARIPRQRSNA